MLGRTGLSVGRTSTSWIALASRMRNDASTSSAAFSTRVDAASTSVFSSMSPNSTSASRLRRLSAVEPSSSATVPELRSRSLTKSSINCSNSFRSADSYSVQNWRSLHSTSLAGLARSASCRRDTGTSDSLSTSASRESKTIHSGVQQPSIKPRDECRRLATGATAAFLVRRDRRSLLMGIPAGMLDSARPGGQVSKITQPAFGANRPFDRPRRASRVTQPRAGPPAATE